MRKAYVVRMLDVNPPRAVRVQVPTACAVKVTQFHTSKVLKLAPRRDVGAEA